MNRLPQLLLVLAIALASFAYGGLVVHYKLFPFSVLSDQSPLDCRGQALRDSQSMGPDR